MKQLSIQERKLHIIEQLIILNDEEVFNKVEELIISSFKRPPLQRFTKQELENRAKISNKNIKLGDVYSQEEVEKTSQKW